MDELSLPEVRRLVDAANALRRQGDASGGAAVSDGRRAERQLDDLFGTGHTLAVYGTLAPGKPNHHVLAPLGGEWTDGLIEGDLLPMGWGAELGYPGFRPRGRRRGGAGVDRSLVGDRLGRPRPLRGPGVRAHLGAGVRQRARPRAGERRLHTVANLYSPTEA